MGIGVVLGIISPSGIGLASLEVDALATLKVIKGAFLTQVSVRIAV